MNRQQRTAIIAAAVVIVGAGIGYAVYRSTTHPAAKGPAPTASSAARAESAREIIAKLQSADHVDYDAAFEQAQHFQSQGQLADAQLLYFFAARNGNGQAAFALARMNDPVGFDPKASLLTKPAPFQAYKWYTVARDQGVQGAAERLQQLHSWADKAAANGDQQAEQLLLEWK